MAVNLQINRFLLWPGEENGAAGGYYDKGPASAGAAEAPLVVATG